MRQTRGLRGQAVSLAVIVAMTLLAAATPAGGQLYEQVYPPPPPRGSNIVDPNDLVRSFDKAMREADLTYSFDRQLVENETARFSATVALRPQGVRPRNPIQVAYENDATLTADCKPRCEFDIHPNRKIRKRFANTRKLTWEWRVVPRQTGSLKLTLEIQPVLILLNSSRDDLSQINEEVVVKVQVHPNRLVYDRILDAASEIQRSLPAKFTVGKKGEVSATLPLFDGHEGVRADIGLTSGGKSIRTSIVPVLKTRDKSSLMRRWTVTPEEQGPVELVFTVKVASVVGDMNLSKEVPVVETRRAEPSLWSRLQAPVLWITPFVALLGAILGLRGHWGGLRSRWLRLWSRRRTPGDDGDAAANG
jgi:hypothetical protein